MEPMKYMTKRVRILFTIFLLIATACQKKMPLPEVVEDHIARISTIKNEVNYKRKGGVNWTPAIIDTKLSIFDLVKTGEKSITTVEFNDHSNLIVYEKSLVVILQRDKLVQKENQVLALKKGGLKGKIPQQISSILSMEVRTPNGWISTDTNKKAVNFDLKIKKNKLKVISNQGNISISTGTQKTTIREGQTATLTNKSTPNELLLDTSDTKLPNNVEILVEDETPKQEKIEITKKEEITFFKVSSPKNKAFKTKKDIIIFSGDYSDNVKAFLNGKVITNNKNSFMAEVKLSEGLNVFTFQIIEKGKKLSHIIYKITKI